jgi:hypothetical protein
MATSDISVRLLSQFVGDSRFDLYELSGKHTPLDKAKSLPFAVAKVLREVRSFERTGHTTDKDRAHVAARLLREKVEDLIAALDVGTRSHPSRRSP